AAGSPGGKARRPRAVRTPPRSRRPDRPGRPLRDRVVAAPARATGPPQGDPPRPRSALPRRPDRLRALTRALPRRRSHVPTPRPAIRAAPRWLARAPGRGRPPARSAPGRPGGPGARPDASRVLEAVHGPGGGRGSGGQLG